MFSSLPTYWYQINVYLWSKIDGRSKTLVIKLVRKRSLKSANSGSYMKGRDELNIEPKPIYNEICKVYIDDESL